MDPARPAIICFWDELEGTPLVVMAARFAGKCKRCGRPIQQGAQMDWTKEAARFI